MGSFSDFLELEILDQIFGGLDYAEPATVYFALWTTSLSDSSTGGSSGEVSGTGYARVALDNNKTTWSVAAAGALENDVAVTFPQATALWGTVTDMAIADAATNGDILGFDAVTTAKNIDNGDTAEFAIGDIDITLD